MTSSKRAVPIAELGARANSGTAVARHRASLDGHAVLGEMLGQLLVAAWPEQAQAGAAETT